VSFLPAAGGISLGKGPNLEQPCEKERGMIIRGWPSRGALRTLGICMWATPVLETLHWLWESTAPTAPLHCGAVILLGCIWGRMDVTHALSLRSRSFVEHPS
jgi:hypothetical protein